MVLTDISQCVNSTCLKEGLHLKLGYYLVYPYFLTNGPGQHWGIMPDKLMPYVFQSYGFTYEFHRDKSLTFTERLPNGTWTSDFGILQRREVDMNAGAQYNYVDRADTFLSTTNYQFYEIHILSSKGKVVVYDFFSFLYKVEGLVWYILMASFFILLFSSAMCEAFTYGRICKQLYNGLWIFLAALFCEGSPRNLSTRRGQALQFTWLFCVLIFMNGLCGQFKAILMVQQDDDVIRTIQDVVDRPHIDNFILENTVFEKVLRDSPLESFQIIYKRSLARRKETFLTLQQLASPATYQRIKDGKALVFLVEQMTKTMLSMVCPMLTGHRQFYFGEEKIYPFNMCLFFNKDAPQFLVDLVNRRLYRTVECGLFDRWHAEFYKRFDQCEQEPPPPDIGLNLQHLTQAFYLLIASLILSFLVFIGELLYCCVYLRYCKTKKKVTA